MNMDISDILNKARETGKLDRSEIISLLGLDNPEDLESLRACADEVRALHCGDGVHLRGLVEFSNDCERRCNYCGLRKPNTELPRYNMTPEEILKAAHAIAGAGLKTIVMQSGENGHYTGEMLAEVVRKIKSQTGLAVTLSVGERDYEDYRLWREAGADRFLLRHETANALHYRFLHPDSLYENRMRCLQNLRKLGYQVGTGCMVGTPRQTIECLADDIEFIRDFQPDMVGIGPFRVHDKTPFRNYPDGELDMTLKMVALARIVTRDALIPATTAIGTLHRDGLVLALRSGADVMMPNWTPYEQRVKYEIYPAKHDVNTEMASYYAVIERANRKVAEGCGHSRKGK